MAAAFSPYERYQPGKQGALVAGRQHATAHLAELDSVRGAATEDDLVAVREKPLAAVELDHRALRAWPRAGDRPRRHKVAGAQRRAVRGRVCELLRERPVERLRIPARDELAVQVYLER